MHVINTYQYHDAGCHPEVDVAIGACDGFDGDFACGHSDTDTSHIHVLVITSVIMS